MVRLSSPTDLWTVNFYSFQIWKTKTDMHLIASLLLFSNDNINYLMIMPQQDHKINYFIIYKKTLRSHGDLTI